MVEDQSGHYPFLTGALDTPRNGDHKRHENYDHNNYYDENHYSQSESEGLNSGLALYNLAGMRESVEYR